jgi:hypothetical protein
MHMPLRLRLEPRPSRIACGLIAFACIAVAAMLVALPLAIWASAAGLLAVLGVAARGFWRCAGGGVPALLFVGLDRRLTVVDRDGRSRDGTVSDDSYVGAALTTIVWRRDGLKWWSPARAILIVPDMLPADDFRRLRVFLRYGRPAVSRATSGTDAGCPPRHASATRPTPLSALGCAPRSCR